MKNLFSKLSDELTRMMQIYKQVLNVRFVENRRIKVIYRAVYENVAIQNSYKRLVNIIFPQNIQIMEQIFILDLVIKWG